jgi:hypothetical protein
MRLWPPSSNNHTYLMSGQNILSIPSKHCIPVPNLATICLRSLTSTTVTRVWLLYKHGGNIVAEVELGVSWESLGARWSLKAPKGSVPEASTPNPYLKIWIFFVTLQELSMTNLSGSHCLSLQEGEGCVWNSCNFDCSLLKDCQLFWIVEIGVFPVPWGLVQPLGLS